MKKIILMFIALSTLSTLCLADGVRLSEFGSYNLTKAWTREVPKVENQKILAVAGDYVYVGGTSEETVQKRLRTNGDIVWSETRLMDLWDEGYTSRIIVDSNYNMYTSKGDMLYKYNDAGVLQWDTQTDTDAIQICAISSDETYLLCKKGESIWLPRKVAVINTSTGAEVVSFAIVIDETNAAISYSSMFDGDNNLIICCGMSGDTNKNGITSVYKYDIAGEYKWHANYIGVFGSFSFHADEPNRQYIAVDIDNNIWAYQSSPFSDVNIRKLGRDSGNVLASEELTTTPKGVFALSTGDIITVHYDYSENELTLRRYNTNIALQNTEVHTDITEYYRTVVIQ